MYVRILFVWLFVIILTHIPWNRQISAFWLTWFFLKLTDGSAQTPIIPNSWEMRNLFVIILPHIQWNRQIPLFWLTRFFLKLTDGSVQTPIKDSKNESEVSLRLWKWREVISAIVRDGHFNDVPSWFGKSKYSSLTEREYGKVSTN